MAEGRSNLSVLVGAHVHNIIFAEGDELVATAVKFQFKDAEYIVKATKEVVLSAGMLFFFNHEGDWNILQQGHIKLLKSSSFPELASEQFLKKMVSNLELNCLLAKIYRWNFNEFTGSTSVYYFIQDHLMVFLNYKLKEETILKQALDGKDALLPLGLSVQCVGMDGEEQDITRK